MFFEFYPELKSENFDNNANDDLNGKNKHWVSQCYTNIQIIIVNFKVHCSYKVRKLVNAFLTSL